MKMIDKIKEAVSLVSDLDVKQKLIEAQQMMLEMQEENRQLKEKVTELEKKLSTKQALSRHPSGCLTDGDGSGVYFCPNCERNRDSIVQMTTLPPDFAHIQNASHECPTCDFTVLILPDGA